ncbi:MAG: glycosyltransferase family A protein [Candidatus Aenigmatarchaeota archaeon]
MKSKISALIFSINEYELVKPKVELLYPYVDEIVIIDSSTDKNQKKLMKNLSKKYKKVKVVWLPPIGIADFYYKIGISECKYDWILQLDSDDFPNKRLLKDLKKLINDKYDAYKILQGSYFFRLFKKGVANPLGVIHWLISIKTRNYKELDCKRYFIEIKRRETLKEVFEKYLIRYTKIESFQLPAKLLYVSDIPFRKIEVHTPDKFKYYRLFSKTSRYNYVIFFISFLVYLAMLELYMIFFVKSKSIWMRYPIYVYYFFIQHPFKNLYISKKIYEKGFYELFELDSKEKILKNARKLNFGNVGIKNFEKLLEYKLREEFMREKKNSFI